MSVTPSIQELSQGAVPFVLADDRGLVIAINPAFEQAYGWPEHELIGQPITLILPESFRLSHQLGFSRYQSTQRSEILGHPLRLATICRDGSERISDHFIVAERSEDGWRFGATLTPLTPDSDSDSDQAPDAS